MLKNYVKGAFIYYVITLRGGGGFQTQLMTLMMPLRGGWDNHQNDDVIYSVIIYNRVKTFC